MIKSIKRAQSKLACSAERESFRLKGKKNLKTLAAILCCAVITTGNMQAQDDGKLDITITQGKKMTISLYGDNNRIDSKKFYQGEELHTGKISAGVNIVIENNTGGVVEPPANLFFHFSFTDPYGRVPFLKESYNELLALFKSLKHSDYSEERYNIVRFICRGGQYVYRTYIPGIDYNYEETLEVKDEPSARVRYENIKVGSNIEVNTFYNTGYPYDVNQFNGSEKATLRLFALGKDDQGNPKETEVVMTEKPLRLYRPDQPLVAALDSMILTYCDPEPGQYRLKMESNWTQEGANRDNILITVNDTVRCYAALDKSKYVAGTDKDMKLHMKLNYGYPYVTAEKEGEDPTVLINTYVLTSDDNTADTIQTSTHKITNASLAAHPLDWEGDLDVALNIEEQEKAPAADCNLYVKVEVIFNGDIQYTRIIPFNYIAKVAPTGIRAITDNQPANNHWYSIQGTRMDSKPVQNGVYIHNHKKVIIK